MMNDYLRLKKERDDLLKIISKLLQLNEDCCDYCKHIPKDENVYKCLFTCEDVKCDKFESGDKAILDEKEIDWDWTCRDFGACPALDNTPCQHCIDTTDNCNFELDIEKLKNLL